MARFERKGLVGLRLLTVPRQMAEQHYAVHAGKHFYEGLVEFITSGPVAAVALEGPMRSPPSAAWWAPPCRTRPIREPFAATWASAACGT